MICRIFVVYSAFFTKTAKKSKKNVNPQKKTGLPRPENGDAAALVLKRNLFCQSFVHSSPAESHASRSFITAIVSSVAKSTSFVS